MPGNRPLNLDTTNADGDTQRRKRSVWSRLIGGVGALALVIVPFSVGSAIAPAAAAGAETTMTMYSSADPSEFGDPVTFTATVEPATGSGTPTGTVQFSLEGNGDFGAPVELDENGQAESESLATTWIGAKLVTATYTGDENFAGNNVELSQDVEKAETTTTVSSSADPSYYGVPVTFTATVDGKWENQNPDGTVQFSIDGENFGDPVPVKDGEAPSIPVDYFEAGSTPLVTATYSGSEQFNGSSGEVRQNIQTTPTETTITSTPNPSAEDEDVTLTVTVTPAVDDVVAVPEGTVLLNLDGSPLGDVVPLVDGVATKVLADLPVGEDSIGADYLPDDSENFASSTAQYTQTVKEFASTTTVTSSANPSVEGAAVTFTATVSSMPGSEAPTGAVQFLVDGAPLGDPVALVDASATSQEVADLTVGTHTVTAEYSGDDVHVASSASLSQAVVKKVTPLPPNNGGGSQLANTGSTVAPLVGGGAALLLLLGAATVVVARRRHTRVQ